MLNYAATDFEDTERPRFSSNLLLCWLSRLPDPRSRREEAERLVEMSESELDTLGLSMCEIRAYLGLSR